MFLSIKMMLEWLASKNKNNEENRLIELGIKIEKTLISLLEQNLKTIDLGGNMHTNEFTEMFISKLVS
jgi:isocitrate/isopropylmalate dehydrogenase